MKILHFSDLGLPDIRLDRYAYITSQLGMKVSFCGGIQDKHSHTFNNFKEIMTNPVPRTANLGIPYFFQSYKRKLKKLYDQLRPDVVHAHNLTCGKICSDLKIPYIYDDHEYWSHQIAARSLEKLSRLSKRHITNRIFTRRVNQWEKEVIRNASTVITVADTMTQEHLLTNPNTITIPNFPSSFEIRQIGNPRQPEETLKVLLTTNYNSETEKASVDKYVKVLSQNNIDLTIVGNHGEKNEKVSYMNYLPIQTMNRILPTFHVGLHTFHAEKQKVGYFKYASPNRVFQYIHGGLTPIIHNEMSFLKALLGERGIFVDQEEDSLSFLLKLKNDCDFLTKRPREMQLFARKTMVFDHCKDRLLQAYSEVNN